MSSAQEGVVNDSKLQRGMDLQGGHEHIFLYIPPSGSSILNVTPLQQ